MQYSSFKEEECEWIRGIKVAFEQANRKDMMLGRSSIEKNEETALSPPDS
jgi:hypothetical protein